jgi:hypothetical protein
MFVADRNEHSGIGNRSKPSFGPRLRACQVRSGRDPADEPFAARDLHGLADWLHRRAIKRDDHIAASEKERYEIEISQLGGVGSALGAALLPIHASVARIIRYDAPALLNWMRNGALGLLRR